MVADITSDIRQLPRKFGHCAGGPTYSRSQSLDLFATSIGSERAF